MLRANRQGRDLRWSAGGHEGSENRWSGCWEPADRQNSLTPRSGPRGTAGEVSQAGNIDVVIGIHVLSLGSRLVAEAYIFTVDLQRWDMGPGNCRYLGTTKEASLGLGRVTVVSTVGNGGVGVVGCMWLLSSRRQNAEVVEFHQVLSPGIFRVVPHALHNWKTLRSNMAGSVLNGAQTKIM